MMELLQRASKLACFCTILALSAGAVAQSLPASLSAIISDILPSAPLATISPGIWRSENPFAAVTFDRAYTSLLLDNPTYFPSEFASIITEVPGAAVTSVALHEESAFPTLFTSVAEKIFSEAVPSSVQELYSTNVDAGNSAIYSQFANGDPGWYTSMPEPVQSFIENDVSTRASSGLVQPTVFRTIIQTVQAPGATSSSGAGGDSGNTNGDGSNGGSNNGGGGGLSTGAKAGIGVGVAVAALIAIAILAFFLLRRRKSKKHNTSAAAQQPEMAPAYNSQPPPTQDQQYYGGPPPAVAAPVGYYGQQESKYDPANGGSGLQPGPYQQPYQHAPDLHNSAYYQSPPAPYGSPPPPDGYYGAKSPTGPSEGGLSPGMGSNTFVSSDVTGSSSAGHGHGTQVATELSAGRTSVESLRHEMPADNR